MRRSTRAFVLGAAAVVSALGCRSNNCDVVERELHARELDLAAARDEIDRCHAINEGLQTELQALRGEPTAAAQGVMAIPVRSLTLGRQTGGRDGDASGGDEALQVVVQPLDVDNQPVKVPGSLAVEAIEITPTGLKQPLSSWQISDDELRRSWRSGLLGSGYFLVLPWKVWPSNDKVRVVAQLRLPDGRLFEADKDVTVRVVPAEKRPAAPPPMPPPDAGPVLPPPTPVEPPHDGGPDLPPVPTDGRPSPTAWKAAPSQPAPPGPWRP